ncbi:hypothetical protein [Belnapia rosea]|uniref:Uncharacterized protein n=1 Tax=Belnapia rosea TaxID=938405 RepID=A0A1G7C1U0_9PROT|nr:hypothetical protein [Belnapia rosea]SDE32740.1 hypothetical protein SAMN04487779_102835 [Belnapia rosea]
MFGFGAGRLAPNDQTFKRASQSARHGRLRNVPHLSTWKVPPHYFEMLRSLPRTEIVGAAEMRAAAPMLPGPDLHVGGLLLPAEAFVFEAAPLDPDFATTHIVEVRRHGTGGAASLRATVLSKVRDWNLWTLTVPGVCTTLSDFEVSPLAEANLADEGGLGGLKHAYFCAAAGLLAIDARQRGLVGASSR